MRLLRSRSLPQLASLVLAVALLASACANDPGANKDNEAEEQPAEEVVDSTTLPDEDVDSDVEDSDAVTRTQASTDDWICADLSNEQANLIFRATDLLTELESLVVDGALDSETVSAVTELSRAFGRLAATSADPVTLNPVGDFEAGGYACNLYGQYASAWEHWIKDNRDDACDIWEAAQTEKNDVAAAIDLGALSASVLDRFNHSSRLIEEGAGRCVDARVN